MKRSMPAHRVAAGALATLSLTAALALAACTSPSSDPSRSAEPSRSTGPSRSADRSPGASSAPTRSTAPELIPSGTARQNLPYFDAVNQQLIAEGGTPHGRDFIDSLVAAGFDKSAMQVTADTTTVGLAADNIQFSVLVDGGCLIGQYGNIGYASTVQPALATGACLAGSTRPIDW